MSGQPAPTGDRRASRDRGAVIPIVAICLPVLLVLTAFAVDLGRQRSLRRTMQARADVIALDLVRLADGRTEAALMPDADSEVIRSANRNDIEPGRVEFDYGTWTEASGFIPTLDSGVPDAVKVTTSDTIDYFFQPGDGSATRSAVARTHAKAGFSIGSFAASVNSGNSALLNRLIGQALGLGILSYDGLATSNLTWMGIANQMGLGTPEELFTGDVSAYEVVDAAAEILARDSANAAQVEVLEQVLGVPSSPLHNVRVGDVITVTPGAEGAALGSTVNVLDFLASSAFIANGSSGVSLPATSLGLPGNPNAVTGSLNLIQEPQTVYGPVGESTGTSQAGVTATFDLGTTSVGNFVVSTLQSIAPNICSLLVLGPVLCALTSRAVSVRVTATVDLDLAAAQGTIAGIRCPSAEELDIDVRSDLVTASISMQAVVTVGTTQLPTFPLGVNGGGGDWNGTADFVLPPDQFDVFRAVNPGSGSIGLDSASITGLGALGPVLTSTLNNLILNAVSQVDANVVRPLSELMGIRVASANVAPRAVDCNTAQLVG